MTTLFDGLNGCSIYIICTRLCSCYMARRNGKKFNNNNACGNIVITLWFFMRCLHITLDVRLISVSIFEFAGGL